MQVRDWLHVEDHARALKLILERRERGESYNVGASNERANIEVARLICELVGCGERIEFVADHPGHDRRYAIDASKVTSQLG